MTETKRIWHRMFNWRAEVSAAPLAVYRISFGLLMLFSTLRFIANGWVETQYIEPSFHFSYYGFEWLPYPTSTGIYLLFAGMVLGAILITLGLFYRFAAALFFFSFTYIELLDKANYLNHYYFVSLIAFLMILVPANRYFSLDVKFGFTSYSRTCPQWSIRILQFQIAVVYIFAGIAKLEADWLFDAQPLKYWLHTAHHWNVIGPLLKQDWVAYAFAWFGCVYDLTIVLFLFMTRTRKVAYIFVIIFHLTTWVLFPIGVFPWVMIVATLVFFQADFHERILNFIRLIPGYHEPGKQRIRELRIPAQLTTVILGTYIIFQLIIPFRYLAYDGNLMWTEQGFRFSWRVMLMEKAGYATFYVEDTETTAELTVNNSTYLTPNQEKMMSTQPDMILEFAHFLEEEFKDTTVRQFGRDFTFNEPEVHAEVFVALNSRPHQLMVDKKYNLAAIENDLSQRHWIEDFKE